MNAEQTLMQNWRLLPPHKQQEVLDFVEFLRVKNTAQASSKNISFKDIQFDPSATPIWELAAQISAKVPDSEWLKLPTDLSQRFDYYQEARGDL
jgi:hypothetical protein